MWKMDGLTFPSLTKVTPAPALRPAMSASITDVSATFEGYILPSAGVQRTRVQEIVLTCVGEDIWGITKSHFPPVQGLQIYMLCGILVVNGNQKRSIVLPKPTEVVDTTFRLGPAAKMSMPSCHDSINENQALTSFEELFVDLTRNVSILTSVIGERGSNASPTLSDSITIMPAAPATFSNSQPRSHFLSSGHATI